MSNVAPKLAPHVRVIPASQNTPTTRQIANRFTRLLLFIFGLDRLGIISKLIEAKKNEIISSGGKFGAIWPPPFRLF
jgi:hypothetical protein